MWALPETRGHHSVPGPRVLRGLLGEPRPELLLESSSWSLVLSFLPIWEFRKNRAPILGALIRPYSKDHSLFGSILGPLNFGKSHIVLSNLFKVFKYIIDL